MKKIPTISLIILTIILIGVSAFYGGIKYTQSKRPNGFNFSNLPLQDRLQRFGNRQPGNNFINGEILSLSKEEGSFTLKLRDGGSKIIFFSDSTQIMKSTNGTSEDLKVGENLMVNGTANTDGSITAQTIQIRPSLPNNPEQPPKDSQ